MNALNKLLEESQKDSSKLLLFSLEQNVLESAPLEEMVSTLKANHFGAVVLVCTDSLENCLKLAGELAKHLPVVLETGFHKIWKYKIPEFARAAVEAGISGVHVPDLPFEEQGQLAVYFLDEDGPFLIREITPASGDRIIQNMQYARGFIWCKSEGDTSFLSELAGDPLMFYLYAVEAAATRPVMLDFDSRYFPNLEDYLTCADGVIAGKDLAETFREEGYSGKKLEEYCGKWGEI